MNRISRNVFCTTLLTNRLFSAVIVSAAKSSTKKMSQEKPWNVVFVLGPPGCGKGTQCIRINQKFGFIHLSAGDLLREERARADSQYGKLIEEHIKNGTIVPVEITCKLLENAMIAHGHPPGFLIDGFPRNQDNLSGWQREMGNKTKLLFVLFMECAVQICVDRCLNRGQGRTDDNEESLKKRITIYNTHTMPIVKYFETDNLVRTVDSSKSPDEVFDQLKSYFEALPK